MRNVIYFPQKPRPMTEEESIEISDGLLAFVNMLSAQMEDLYKLVASGDIEMTTPMPFTVGDFILFAKTMVYMKLETNDRFKTIMDYLAGEKS